MRSISISFLTVCGIDELAAQSDRKVSHVLSLLDPDRAVTEAFQGYGDHHRTTLRFHDVIDAEAGKVMPRPQHVAEIIAFGRELSGSREGRADGHLLVHCHMGISRSTAAMLTLLAQVNPDEDEDSLFKRLRAIRPRAWPNSLMIGFADEALGRRGRLVDGLRRHYRHQVGAQPDLARWMVELGREREVRMAD